MLISQNIFSRTAYVVAGLRKFIFSVADPIGRIFFVVKSAAGNVVNREILRRTWASMRYIDGYKIATIFVIGKIDVDPKAQIFLNEEYNRYGDILQLNISDKYR